MRQIVVTGGTSGIGEAVAKHFAGKDDAVVIVGTRADGQDVATALGQNVMFKRADITNEGQVKSLFAGLDNLDVLVNAAGIYIGNDAQGVINLSAKDFEEEWRVNSLGTFLACKYAMPLLLKTKGNIVNISSISGMQPDEASIGYASSKAATNMLTKCLALAHVSAGVRVNAVCPGPIDTPMLRSSFDGQLEGNSNYESWISGNPMKRYGQVEDVVKGVAYLSDSHNTYVTGTLLTIDGGWTAKAL